MIFAKKQKQSQPMNDLIWTKKNSLHWLHFCCSSVKSHFSNFVFSLALTRISPKMEKLAEFPSRLGRAKITIEDGHICVTLPHSTKCRHLQTSLMLCVAQSNTSANLVADRQTCFTSFRQRLCLQASPLTHAFHSSNCRHTARTLISHLTLSSLKIAVIRARIIFFFHPAPRLSMAPTKSLTTCFMVYRFRQNRPIFTRDHLQNKVLFFFHKIHIIDVLFCAL